jgi:ABC-type transport system involved in multi-copper enzyme maturation permease subunit
MKRLLNIELQKLWQNRASRALIITYFVLLSFIALLASVNFSFLGLDFRLADMGIFNFPFIWHFNTYVATWLKLFLAIIIVSMMANEYTYGTLKQNLIDGLSKQEFITSKSLTVLLFATASTLFVFIMSLILGYSFSSYTEPSIVFSDLQYIGGYFLNMMLFFSFCLFAGMLVKRSAFAIGFIFLFYVAESIIKGVLYFGITKDMVITQRVMNFMPLEAMQNLIKEPITRFQAYKAIENQVSGSESAKFYGIHWYEALIAMAWIAIFLYLSYRILKKRDL